MPRISMVLPFVLGACLAVAQDQSNTAPVPDPDKLPVHNLPVDPDKLADAVRDSYYHPDNLSSLECSVSFDWSGVMKALQVDDPAPERLKIIEGLKVRTRATRDQATEVTLNWTGGEPPERKDRIESGIKQLVSLFYQVYWPMMATSSVPPGTAFARVEPLDDGNMKAYATLAQGNAEITIDKDRIPIHYVFDQPSMKVTVDAHYTPSPKPTAGDLRRLTELDVSEQRSASKTKYEVILDYQALGEFYVPQHVTFNVVGAVTFGMDFSGCSAKKK